MGRCQSLALQLSVELAHGVGGGFGMVLLQSAAHALYLAQGRRPGLVCCSPTLGCCYMPVGDQLLSRSVQSILGLQC